jgi:hypothetical protein
MFIITNIILTEGYGGNQGFRLICRLGTYFQQLVYKIFSSKFDMLHQHFLLKILDNDNNQKANTTGNH